MLRIPDDILLPAHKFLKILKYWSSTQPFQNH